MDSLELANNVIDDYTRQNTQKDLSKKYGLSCNNIRKILKLAGFSHGIQRKVYVIQRPEYFSFLNNVKK